MSRFAWVLAGVVGTLAVAGGSGGALAQARPDTRAMSCAQAQSLVEERGAVVLSTGTFTYDRFVFTGAACGPRGRAVRRNVPTADQNLCTLHVCGAPPSSRR